MHDIDPAAVMADHAGRYGTPEEDFCGVCLDDGDLPSRWPCEPYRLAEALDEALDRIDRARAACAYNPSAAPILAILEAE